jgi:hypothetical protein
LVVEHSTKSERSLGDEAAHRLRLESPLARGGTNECDDGQDNDDDGLVD